MINISLAQKHTVLTNFGDIITMCVVAMDSMSIVKTSLDNMNATFSTVCFAHLPLGNVAMLSNSCKHHFVRQLMQGKFLTKSVCACSC